MLNNEFVRTGRYQVPFHTTMIEGDRLVQLGETLADGRVVTRTLVERLKRMRNVALDMLARGYYDSTDYHKFCEANNLLLF